MLHARADAGRNQSTKGTRYGRGREEDGGTESKLFALVPAGQAARRESLRLELCVMKKEEADSLVAEALTFEISMNLYG